MRMVAGQFVGGYVDPTSPSLCDHVRRRLVETLGDGDASLDGVARSLGISIHALHRGLREAGTSFEGLIGATRRQLSVPCVDLGGRSVDEIAFLFGFPDSSGAYWLFHRPTAAASRRYSDSTAWR